MVISNQRIRAVPRLVPVFVGGLSGGAITPPPAFAATPVSSPGKASLPQARAGLQRPAHDRPDGGRGGRRGQTRFTSNIALGLAV